MKNNKWMILWIGVFVSMPIQQIAASVAPVQSQHVTSEFTQKKDGTWTGKMNDKTYWYKLDEKAALWWSTDGKNWAAVESGMWADKDGKWLKIGSEKLWWSADSGKTWAEVPDWTWEGPNGEWYKFDSKWNLWEKK
ncbi:MAG: hypothetical protein IT244_07735 [Bacteroidia bacterium]|nr:hypothetical protein [Bacteroidia bacterium]